MTPAILMNASRASSIVIPAASRVPKGSGALKAITKPLKIRTAKKDDQTNPDETALLGDDREDEVRVGLGEIEELLHPVSDPHAEGAAGPEGDRTG